MEDWVMQEETGWEFETDSLLFALEQGEKRVEFKITRIALNDYFHTDDTKEQAIANFETHCYRVFLLAKRLIDENPEQERHTITFETCQRLAL